jgi:hypothetical protein
MTSIWDNLNNDIYLEICKYIYYPQDEKLLDDLRSYILVKKNLLLYFNLDLILWHLSQYNNNEYGYYDVVRINEINGRVSWREPYKTKFKNIISKYLFKMSVKERYVFLNKMSNIV